MQQYLRISKAAEELNMSQASLRWLRFNSSDRRSSKGDLIAGNGFAEAFLKLKGSVLVDIQRFREILLEQNGRVYVPPQQAPRPVNDTKPAIQPHSSAKFCPECGSRLIPTNDKKDLRHET